MELTINPEEPAFEYTWCRPRKTPNAHIKVVGTLHCSVSSTRASDEPLKSTALQTEHLRILSASHLKSKKIIEDGQAFHCESFCGYIESTSGRYPEINLAFRPPDHDGPYEGAWTNDDDGDELVARLYVDGSVEANEEISIRRRSPENPVKLGHLLDKYDRERQFTWRALATNAGKLERSLRGDARKPSVDVLSSFRIVVSRCMLFSRKGSSRLSSIQLESVSDVQKMKEAMLHAGSRLSHSCVLSESKTVRGKPIAARPKTVPDVEEVVPLVEFIFYYKSAELLEQLGLKPPGTRALQNRQIDDQPDTRQPETLRLERIEERIQPIQHLNQTGIDVETQNSNRLGLQSHEALSAPNAAAKRAAQPEDGSSKISKRIKSEKPVSGSGTRTEPFHVEDYESASDKEEVGYSSSKRANKAGPSEAAFANSQTSDLSPSNDWDASKVSSWLFKTTPIPKGSMGILYDIGLTSNISDFLKEQNYLDEDFKKVLALESFSKLRRNGWSFFNVCRLFKILEMKIPSSKEREENGVL